MSSWLIPSMDKSPNTSMQKWGTLLGLADKLKGNLGKYMLHFNPKYPFLIPEADI